MGRENDELILRSRLEKAYANLGCPKKRAEHYFKLNNRQPPDESTLEKNEDYLKIQLDTTRRLRELQSPQEWKQFHKHLKLMTSQYIQLMSDCFQP
eukprot:UN17464